MEKMQKKPVLLKIEEHWSVMGDHYFFQFYDFITNSSFLSCQSPFCPTLYQHALYIVLSPPLFSICELSQSHISFSEHADHCIFSSLPDLSSDLLQHLDLSTSKAKHIICSSPDLKSPFLLHFLSWVMTLSATWLPKRRYLVSFFTPLPKLCLFYLLFQCCSITFTTIVLGQAIIFSYLGCTNPPLTQLKIIRQLIITTTVKYLFHNLVCRLFVIYILFTFSALFSLVFYVTAISDCLPFLEHVMMYHTHLSLHIPLPEMSSFYTHL